MIDFKEAHDVLNLNVERIDPKGDLWNDVWELYCRSIAFLQQHQRQGAAKLFESESVSLMLHLQAMVVQPQPSQQPRMPPTRPATPRPAPRPQQPSPKSPKATPSPAKKKEKTS